MVLEGKVAIVTGAARGLGREYSRRLAKEGALVVAADLNDPKDTVAEVKAAGGRAIGIAGDIARMADCSAMAEAAVKAFGRIDVLVNNAALYGPLKGGRFTDLAEEEWDRCMAVNVKGMWQCCKAVAAAMKQAGGGSIINISSLAAVYGLPFALHYTTSKGAVIGLTRGLARELGRDWIRVNAIAPSAVLTEGTDEFMGAKKDRAIQVITDGQTLKRTMTVEDLAGTVIYLASDASKFVTGQTIMVDGGTVML